MAYPSHRKEGLSVSDAASILHCTPATIRSWIDSGKLGALLSDTEVTPGHKRSIRILPGHIRKYMSEHRSKFDEATLKTWGVLEEEPAVKVETMSEALRRDISGEELVNNPELFDALCRRMCGGEETEETEETETIKQADKPVTIEEAETVRVVVDGRIAIANISKESAVAIVGILMNDAFVRFKAVSIEIA